MNTIIKEWRQKPHGFITINRHLELDTMLFADDLVLVVVLDDDFR